MAPVPKTSPAACWYLGFLLPQTDLERIPLPAFSAYPMQGDVNPSLLSDHAQLPLIESPSRMNAFRLRRHRPLFLGFLATKSYKLLELNHYNLGIRSQPQRWSPRSRSAGSENLHLPDPA